MPFDFPNSPTLNQTATAPNGAVFVWDGAKWTTAENAVMNQGAGLYLPLSGSSPMTGPLTLSGNATQPMHAVPLQQINTAAAGGPFLPLSGGIVARHMSSAAYDANITINATALGSGTNGPPTTQTGMTLNLVKDGWAANTSAVGEVDGAIFTVRQGGTLSDASGFNINVAGTGNGFLCIDESVVQQLAPNTGTILYGIRTQEGGMDPVGGLRIGKMLRADNGNLSSAIYIINTTGAHWGNALVNIKDGVQNLTIDDGGNITTSGTIMSTAGGIIGSSAPINATDIHTTNLWLRADNVIGIKLDTVTNGIQFYLGANCGEILASGGLTIYGTKVLGTQIAGWGTSTGGVRGAITASSTLPQVAAALAQLLTDLKTHGMIGA